MRRRLTDGELEILAEQNRDAADAERAWAAEAPDAESLPTEAEWDERAAGYDWPAELDMDPDGVPVSVPVVIEPPPAEPDPQFPW